ncbi:MAG: phosphatidate cytidylyltransferase [Alphaproteobacteria bacterium PA4]|nr:MAG: phosphatidate cytidylyltransferase [Alphaproteobacteria bacterium PA4]
MRRRWPVPWPNSPQGSAALAVADGFAARNPLLARILTGVVLVVVALAAVQRGGPFYTALIAAAVLIMFAEWSVMLKLGRGVRLAGLALLGGSIIAMTLLTTGEAVLTLVIGGALIGLFIGGLARGRGFWAFAGILYCGLPALALIWLRGLALGLAATVFVLVCVWATDIAAYFTGRAIGGPKLAPAISPNKTQAGAIGGIIGAMIVGGGLAMAYLVEMQGQGGWKFAIVAGVLAVLAILGDLFESWLKRRTGVKDSGNILPGHGGVMDRLDGLVPVAIAGAAFFAVTGWAG